MMPAVDAKRLAMGTAVMAAIFAFGVVAASTLEPPIGTSRPTTSDWLLRLLPVIALVAGGYVGSRRCRCSRGRQGLASIVINWLVLALLYLAGDRITGENVFDPSAIFVTSAPWFILLGAVGVALTTFTDRPSTRAPSRG